MASFHHPRSLIPLPQINPTKLLVRKHPKIASFPRTHFRTSGNIAKFVVNSVVEEAEVLPVRSGDSTDQQEGMAVGVSLEMELEGAAAGELVGGFATSEGPQFSFEAFPSSLIGGGSPSSLVGKEEMEKLVDRSINAMIVLAAGSFAVTKLLTIDHDYWHGWTIFEILRYVPQHNWSAYEEALKANPVLAKMVISGVVYSLGDWIAQCFEGKPLFEFDRARMLRSGLVGFTLHGSLSHYYYELCEALFPFQDWWVVPAKVAFDQTVWAALWNSIYYTVVAFLRFESPVTTYTELKATFWPMLTAGWKLWPFAHLITYGLIPVEQRLLWVDCVELVWVTILSTFSNENSEARITEALSEARTSTPSPNSLEECYVPEPPRSSSISRISRDIKHSSGNDSCLERTRSCDCARFVPKPKQSLQDMLQNKGICISVKSVNHGD